jgi:hypothetical protein
MAYNEPMCDFFKIVMGAKYDVRNDVVKDGLGIVGAVPSRDGTAHNPSV